jgi:transcriptional antiterminator
LNKSSVSTNQYKIEERRRQVASLLAQSLTERQIAAQLNVSQPTIHRDIDALKEMSQQFVYDLAKSDLAYYYKQSLDGLDEVKKQAWTIYLSTNDNIQTKDRLAALRLIADCNVNKFELLNAGPSVLAMKSMEERLRRIEIETPEATQ